MYLSEVKNSSYRLHSTPILRKLPHLQANRTHRKVGNKRRKRETTSREMSRILRAGPYLNRRALNLPKIVCELVQETTCANHQMLLPADRCRPLQRSYNRTNHNHHKRPRFQEMTLQGARTSGYRKLRKTEKYLQAVALLEAILLLIYPNKEARN